MTTIDIAAQEAANYIAGSWRTGRGASTSVVDPATEEVLATVPDAAPADVEAALDAAVAAQHDWARTPAVTRGDALRAMADVVEEHGDRLARLLVAEVGKPLAQAQGEVAFAVGFLRYNASWDRILTGDVLGGDVADEVVHLLRDPVGVVAAINPWNFPLAVFCRKLGPALLTGNTVVAKPSEVTPLTTIEAVRLMTEAVDLPAGVLNLVTGAGGVGAALSGSPKTSMVSFTGHRDTGKRVMAAASEHLTRVALELGGKAPAIVWADADLDLAVPAIVDARHANAGQVCTAAERVLVHTDLLEEFTDRYVAAVEGLRVGDPMSGVDMGPLVSADQHAKVERALTVARSEGASVLTGGGRPAGSDYERGYWYAPTVLRGVTPEMSVMTEETFGPVTPIVGVSDLSEAVGLANDSRYGLSAYLFSDSYREILQTVQDLEFGEIYVNRTLGESVHAHHAGFKESGIGGEDGQWGLLKYTQIKTVYHYYGSAPRG